MPTPQTLYTIEVFFEIPLELENLPNLPNISAKLSKIALTALIVGLCFYWVQLSHLS